MLDRATEAEASVLGSILLTNGRCLDDIHLIGEDFYAPANGDLYDLMVQQHRQGRPVDPYTLADVHPEYTSLMFQSMSMTPTAVNVSYYADIVSRRSLLRRLSVVGQRLIADPEDMDATQLADRARMLVDRAIGDMPQTVRYMSDLLGDVVDKEPEQVRALPSPWPSLNELIDGFRPGAVYVVAARPGVGKSVIATQVASTLAQHGGVAFSSLEMSADEVVTRIVAERAQVNVGKIKNATMDARDRSRVDAVRADLAAMPVAVDDRATAGVGDVRGFAREVKQQSGLAAVIVDYLQLMSSRSRVDRHLQVAEFSRQLKIMAKEFQVPVIALSQLNRLSLIHI